MGVMTRFRVGDTFADHPKAELAGNAAVGAWTRMGSYSARYLTEGRIPGRVALRYGTAEEIDALVSVGLLTVFDGGYQMHDFLGDNPTKERVEQEREAARQRSARNRSAARSGSRSPSGSGGSSGERHAERDGGGNAGRSADRSRTSSSFRTTNAGASTTPRLAAVGNCDYHHEALPCRGCAADAKAGDGPESAVSA